MAKGTRTSAEKFTNPKAATTSTVGKGTNTSEKKYESGVSSVGKATNTTGTKLQSGIDTVGKGTNTANVAYQTPTVAAQPGTTMGSNFIGKLDATPETAAANGRYVSGIDSSYVASPTTPSLNDAIANAAREALTTMTDAEKTGVGSLFNQILNREKAAQSLFPINTGSDKTTSGANVSTKYDGTPATNGGKSTNYTYNSSRTSGLPTGSGSTGLFDTDSLYALLNSRLQEYENNYNTLMQNLLNQYNSNSASIESEYANALKALGANLSDTENLLRSQYDTSQNTLEEQRRRALQEAYIQRMMEQKSLSDTLADYGLSGGATESVLSNLLNNYRGNRNSIENNATVSLRDLLEKYNSNVASARERYNTSLQQTQNNRLNAMRGLADSLAAAQANAENARTQARAGAYDDLYNTLANLYLRSM